MKSGNLNILEPSGPLQACTGLLYLYSLINPENFYLPLLHIELGFIKNLVKAVDQNNAGFMYLKNKFPRISDAKIIESVFVGLI